MGSGESGFLGGDPRDAGLPGSVRSDLILAAVLFCLFLVLLSFVQIPP
jgi:hypothetical protein